MTYKVELTPTQSGYSASCLDLPECSAEGKTEGEVLANMRHTIHERLAQQPAGSGKIIRYVDVPEPKIAEELARLARFEVKGFPLGMRPEWIGMKVDDILDALEGPDRKW